MKTRKLYFVCMLIAGLIGLNACSDDDENSISPSETSIRMEGEGGEYKISLNSEDWQIAEVINKNGDMRIHGEAYTADGTLVSENSPLELDDLGSLEAFWQDKGFRITRDEPKRLKIYLKPNATGEEFSFGILLRNEIDTREIVVSQQNCQGYTIEKIEYFLDGKTDGDSLYWKENTRIRYESAAPSTLSFATYGGVDITNTSSFNSDDYYAFAWTQADSVKVEVPSGIQEERVLTGGDKRVYGIITKTPFGHLEDRTTLEVPAKTQLIHSLEWRIRQVSYRLTLKSKRTKDTITVEGKWLETTPTGGTKLEKSPLE